MAVEVGVRALVPDGLIGPLQVHGWSLRLSF